jgi:sulfate adenylyltransferase subunit 1
MIVRANNSPEVTQDLEVMLVWFDGETVLKQGGKYALMHTTQNIRCVIKDIHYKLDINSLHREQEDLSIGMNDVARIVLRTTKPIFVDPYRKNRITGSLILIDEATNNTVAACMVI